MTRRDRNQGNDLANPARRRLLAGVSAGAALAAAGISAKASRISS